MKENKTMDYSDMSLVSYMGSVKLNEKRLTLMAIQEPLFHLYTQHIKHGQLSRLQERHLAISRAGLTMRWKANESGPPESCLVNIAMDSLIYCNAVSFQTISAEAYSNEMKIKKSSKKRKENYGSFQPVGDIDRYNSSLFIEIRKPYAYLHGQAYKPLIFVYVTDALIMHAAICKGEQEDVIHKVRVCDNLKRDSYEEEKSIYQSRNNGLEAPSSQLYYGASEIVNPNRSRHSDVYHQPDQYSDSTYQNNTRQRDSRPNQSNGSSREREESPYYQRRLPSPEVIHEDQVYRKLPLNKVLPSEFIPPVALREVPKDKGGSIPLTPDNSRNNIYSSSSPTNGETHYSDHSKVKSFPNPTQNLRSVSKQQERCPNPIRAGIPPPPSGPAPKAPTVYSTDDRDYDEEQFQRSIVMKGTKDEEIISSFSGINLSSQNTSFDMNNLHDALGYLP